MTKWMHDDERAAHMVATWTLSLGLLLTISCATTGEAPPAKMKDLEGGGFEITQDVRVPGGLRADFSQAVDAIDEGNAERAVELLEGVTAGAPDAVAPWVDLGIAYGMLERHDDATRSLTRAVELAPKHPVALNELGMALRRQGRFDEARERYEAALRVAPEFHHARRNLAILCDLYLNDLESALSHYEIYATAVPEDEKVAMWIVDLRNRTGR
jgi:Flp pilus assembly protein TadD